MPINHIRSLKDFRSQAIAAGLSRTIIWEHVCKALKVQSIFDLLDYPDSTLKSFRQISDKRVKELREVLGPLMSHVETILDTGRPTTMPDRNGECTGALKLPRNECRVILYSILGKVASEGRGRAVKNGNSTRVVTPSATRIGRQEHIKAFVDRAMDGWKPWIGPVNISIIVYRRKPKDWWPGKHCKGKPDLDNVAKLTMDALSGYAYPDDTYVSSLVVRREWDECESVEVCITFFPNTEKPSKKNVS